MKLRKQVIIISGLLFFPIANATAQYEQTPSYSDTVQWADSLNGLDAKTDPRFQSYCEQYATLSVNQASRRISQQCTAAIPLSNNNIAGRWGQNKWAHKSWCLSVSSPASRGELVSRENSLRNCISQQRPTNNAAIRNSCLANDQIHKQAANGNVAYVNKCLNAGVNPNTIEANGWTPLHSAARWGHLDVVRLLVSNGARTNVRDINGKTPLDQAIAGGFNDVVIYLMK